MGNGLTRVRPKGISPGLYSVQSKAQQRANRKHGSNEKKREYVANSSPRNDGHASSHDRKARRGRRNFLSWEAGRDSEEVLCGVALPVKYRVPRSQR